ncbi:unnamed protein product [Sphenostylis stenocarpa]|uniref:Uncharacterized protein n=1 Tax=Sphenostylis stenocarpa TaxID=92480 RepID=A0AA86VT51_9FABA|nr:unnamed protein product [Sphenostylis stenocarpa]
MYVGDLMNDNCDVIMRFGNCCSSKENKQKEVTSGIDLANASSIEERRIGSETTNSRLTLPVRLYLKVQKEREREHVGFMSWLTQSESNSECSPITNTDILRFVFLNLARVDTIPFSNTQCHVGQQCR